MKELSNRPQDLLDIAALKEALNDQSDPTPMQNAKFKDLTPIIEHLFWWVPEKERTSLSDDSIVEAVLSNGDEKMVKQLFDVFGIEKVAETFYRQISGRRINYRPRTVNYFRHYFQRHAQRYSNGKAD